VEFARNIVEPTWCNAVKAMSFAKAARPRARLPAVKFANRLLWMLPI
jgi:hypothetical protein